MLNKVLNNIYIFLSQLAIAFFALIAVSMAQLLIPTLETYLTGVGEIARDGHSRIVDHRFINPALNRAILNRGYLNGGFGPSIYDILRR
jgi:hypothetical protein